MSKTTELTKEEQALINKLEEETKNTSGGLPSYVAAISENAGSAIELNNELSKRYGNTPISLQELRKAGNFKNIMCSSSILGSALGLLPSAIEFNDALTSDIKNSRIDDTARVGLKIVVGIGIGAILFPYTAGAATVGMIAVGSAMVGYLSSLAGNIIDESWEAGKDYLKDLWSQLETRLNDFRNTLSPELQTVFDQCANPIFEGLQVCPTSLNALQTTLQNDYSDELNKAANNLGLNQCPLPQDKMDDIDELMDIAEKTTSPLIVDLDGDGVETSDIHGNVYFDHDNNGFAEKTSWVGKDDGLLVRDLNGNGQIDDGTELFGNNSVLSNGQKAANGFEALKDLDSNKDGVFNNSDAAWSEVQVWKDTNQNGFVDEGELLSMDEANIKEINLDYQNDKIIDANGNTIGQTGSFVKKDNSIGNISDIWFVTDASDTVDRTNVIIPDDIKELPDLIGSGNVHNLHEAMALDESGTLKALVEQFAEETNIENRKAILLNIIYHWSGVQNMDPNGRDPTQVYGKVIDDTRKLEALEEFMGKEYLGTWCWGERDPNPHGKAAPYILRAFDILFNDIYNELLSQTHYKTLLENITMTWLSDDQCWQVDVSEVISNFQQLYAENHENGIASLREFEAIIKSINIPSITTIYEAFRSYGSLTGNDLDIMFAKFGYTYGTDLNDDLTGTSDVDEINGLAGNDSIYGGAGNDTLDGGTGNDNIFGEDGNDILIGGEGNDYLIGGNGADTYIFNPGFGNDAIDNSDDNASANEPDIIQFGEGILASKTTLGRQGYDLIITVSYDPDEEGYIRPNDSIRIYSYFDQQGTSSATVNSIVFADGTTWDYEYVRDHWNSIPGANGGVTLEGNNEDNTINGTNYNDILIGNGGNDTINAGNGNDRLLGGTGNDTLDGGNGDDRYLWSWGDGLDTLYDFNNHDTIVFGNGISEKDLVYRNEGNNLRIIVKGNESQGLILQDFFSSNLNYKIEDLKFYDGKIIHLSEIPLMLQQKNTSEEIKTTSYGDTVYANNGDDTVNGGDGNDIIYGGRGNDTLKGNNGNDILIGGTGNDTLNGGYGDDTYIYNVGDGVDTIEDYENNSTTGKNDKIKFGAGITYDDLSFARDGSNLIITLFNDICQQITIKNQFGNYKNWIEYLEFSDGNIVSITNTSFVLEQSDANDNVSGTAYDDTIYGNGGNDTLRGDAGNDTLVGGKGNDTLEGGYDDDTYIWNWGDGFDTISDYQDSNTISRNDKIKLGEGISFEDLSFERSDNNLYVYIKNDRTQGFELKNQFSNADYGIEYVEFADGSTCNLKQMGFTFNQTDKDESMSGTGYDDVIYAGEGTNTISGGNGNDIICSGSGNDTLRGDAGNDTLVGGKGNDNIEGGDGNDTYIWNWGDGFDTIYDSNGTDTLKLGEGITFEDLSFEREGNDLYVYVKNDRSQGFLLRSEFYKSYQGIDTIEFADGSTCNLKQMGFTFNQTDKDENMSGTGYDDIIYAGEGTNTISGGNGNDIIYSGSGNDTLRGDTGNDTLAGGTGNDNIDGGYDDDTYVWNWGDGFDIISDYQKSSTASRNDKIKLGEGISFEDLSFERDGNDLYVYVKNDKTQGFKLNNQFYNNYYGIEYIEFADGSTCNLKQMGFTFNQTDKDENMSGTGYDDIIYAGGGTNTISGGNGNDIIYSGSGNDTLRGDNGNDMLVGGKGNDTLDGGYDDDTYIWNWGDGFDTISDYQDSNTISRNDKIKLGEGISFEDLSFEREGSDLYVYIKNDKTQGFKLNNQLGNADYGIEYIEFADGSTCNLKQMGFTFNQTDKDENMSGTGYDDIIYGNKGNDTIDAGNGNDILVGNAGQDRLQGGAGNDTYIWNIGDGKDTISDTSGTDKIKFGENIIQTDLQFQQKENNLKIIIQNNPNQGIIIENYFSESSKRIEHIEFADGTNITIDTDSLVINDAPDKTINGTAEDEELIGGEGNDIIITGDGYNDITGNKGNDIITGGFENDAYYYNKHDGYDTITDPDGKDKIIFGEGISKEDILLRRNENDLLVTFNNDDNCGIQIKKFFENNNYKIEQLQFSSGVSLSLTRGLSLQGTDGNDNISGTAYDDTITGDNGNDIISGGSGIDIINGGKGFDTINGDDGADIITGGTGNDVLNGGAGADTYIWNLGDDLDVITADNSDILTFGSGITSSDLTYRCEGNNLRIIVKNDESQGIILSGFFNGNQLGTIKFADGSNLLLSQTGLTLQQDSYYGDTITGTIYDDKITATVPYSVKINGGNGDNIIIAGDGMNTINTESGNDTITAGKGGNIINSGAGDDIIITGNGADTISAGAGKDEITAGQGDDYIDGGEGDDIYYYNKDDGFDTIMDTAGYDKIIFGEGVTIDNFTYKQENNNLIIYLNNEKTQGIKIKDYYIGKQIEELIFANNTSINLPLLDLTLRQSNEHETVNGNMTSETIYGYGGNDTINGNDGNDTLIGGTGNDTLNGGGDNDIYIYNLGDGLDTITDNAGSNEIVFGEGITQNNLSFTQIGNNLLIYLNGDKNQGIMINNFFYNDAHKIGEIHFADNSVFYLSESGLTLDQSDRTDNMTINGTDYNDTIIGGIGNDTINAGDDDDVIAGGRSNDTLNGGQGRDTYIYNLGDGADTINEYKGKDKIKFGQGITSDNLTFTRDGNNLVIKVNNDINQSITINKFYENADYQIETLQFADGKTQNISTTGLILQQTDANDNVGGTSYNDTIYGKGGHDTIDTGDGNDILIGGVGNDILKGGSGDDTYTYNLGDGYDIIDDVSGQDKILFGKGITAENLFFEQVGNNLRIFIDNKEGEGIQINNQLNDNTTAKIETIEFYNGSTLDISNADQLIQAMNSFGAGTSSTMDVLSNATQDVSDMYNLASGSDLIKKAI